MQSHRQIQIQNGLEILPDIVTVFGDLRDLFSYLLAIKDVVIRVLLETVDHGLCSGWHEQAVNNLQLFSQMTYAFTFGFSHCYVNKAALATSSAYSHEAQLKASLFWKHSPNFIIAGFLFLDKIRTILLSNHNLQFLDWLFLLLIILLVFLHSFGLLFLTFYDGFGLNPFFRLLLRRDLTHLQRQFNVGVLSIKIFLLLLLFHLLFLIFIYPCN